MGEEIPPQFSPDGRYWWDGEQWIPAEQLPKPMDEPGAFDEWEEPKARRSPLLLFGVAGLVLVLLVAGVGTGIVSGLIHLPGQAATGGATRTPKPSPTLTPMPTPLRATTLPKLTPTTLIGLLQTQGLSCGPAKPESFGFSWTCRGWKGDLDELVYFISADQQEVKGIRATVTDNSPKPEAAHAATLLGVLATVPYEGGDPKKAQAWVSSHLVDDGAIILIGPVYLRTSPREPNKPVWVLDIYPNSG